MALVLADRVKETTTSTGTGPVSLLGASTGFRPFSAVGDGNTTYYCIAEQTGNAWEVGIGTYTSAGATLSRDTVLSSSNSGSLVSFNGGTKDVFVTYPSERAVYTSGTSVVFANNATVANNQLTNSTISGKALGTNLDTLTMAVSGVGLSGSATFNGSAPATYTVTSNATSSNTPSTVVARDASGNFSAGTITAALNGNASTSTSSTTATNIAGGAAGSLPYNSASGTTTFLALGTSGYVLTADGGAPTWTAQAALSVGSASTATTATSAINIASGGAGQIPYNTGAGATSFVAAGTAGQLLQSNGTSAPSWVTPSYAAKAFAVGMSLVFG